MDLMLSFAIAAVILAHGTFRLLARWRGWDPETIEIGNIFMIVILMGLVLLFVMGQIQF